MCQKALGVSRGLLVFLCFAGLLGARSVGLEPATFSIRSLTACCDEVDPYSILKSHGCLLRRPQKEDRRSRRKARNEKERGRLSVWGEPLLSQALREEVSPRKLAFARESTRQKPEDRRVCQET